MLFRSSQRILYALAAYNGGFSHIRDAMALTKKYGGNPYNWEEVKHFVLKLSNPYYYRDPVVKRGFMRGTETADYVERIQKRWSEYCGGNISSGRRMISPRSYHGTPTEAKKKNKYKI